MKIRVALSRVSNDRWPIMFREDCERTQFDSLTGKDKSLVEVIEELDSMGYDLISYDECKRLFNSNGNRYEN